MPAVVAALSAAVSVVESVAAIVILAVVIVQHIDTVVGFIRKMGK